MNVCVAHLQVNVCMAKNFGAWTEKVGHPWLKQLLWISNRHGDLENVGSNSIAIVLAFDTTQWFNMIDFY